ncbi:hypothetical protein F443_14501 [Phytophthora nicotianae P1569]|uniref:PTM/DIR17-like Tudor domain-containing protein n=1 Tax=Phytophthora nicotianae P1569 TaxID=1317065 RepID=V9EL83_PHYNI|nr:hypothetical protein F443_14501 [Phytophthora nicotianae P1569]
MPARPVSAGVASAPGSTSSSPGHTSASQRHKSDSGWLNNSQNQNMDNSGSPSSAGTQDEDIRSKPARPSSAGSQGSASSSSSTHKTMEIENPKPSSNQLPSLSSGSAVLLQLRDRQRSSSNSPPTSLMRSGEASGQSKPPPQSVTNAGGSSQNQLHSFRRVREEGNPLIPDEDMDEDEVEDVEDEEPSAPPSPSDQRGVHIMFHGREIFAEDLIGLRVAKTFAGHGRFLGQVVRFDKKESLYTVVYADGDAEDLTVDGTLQILIQDEIERADPAQSPPSISLLLMKGEDGSSPASPDTGDFMMAPPSAPHRTLIQVSEREAQFVISLFENHALPALVRQGWRVQTNAGRGETRFVSPSGEIFPTPLDVVGHIATDNELLTACFPANVHSAILSLLPRDATSAGFNDTGSNHSSTGSASRKRTTSDSPSAEQFDGKRTRQARDDSFGGVAVPMRGRMRGGPNTALYRPEDLDRRAEAASRLAAYRGQGMGGRIRMSGDRFVGGETTSGVRIQAPPELRGYRRPSTRDPTMENPFSYRWSGADHVDSADYARRFADSPGWRERGDAFVSDRQLEAHPRNRIRAEGRYIHRLGARNPDAAESAVAAGTPTGYYRDSTSSPGGQASPMTNGLTYPQYATMRARSGPPRIQRETASFMSPSDTVGASAAFSMVDVDRISTSRPGSAHSEQPRGRSPRQNEEQQAYLQHQSLHHRRTNSGPSYHNQRSESHHSAEPTSEAQKEQNSSTTTGTASTTSQAAA